MYLIHSILYIVIVIVIQVGTYLRRDVNASRLKYVSVSVDQDDAQVLSKEHKIQYISYPVLVHSCWSRGIDWVQQPSCACYLHPVTAVGISLRRIETQ